MGWLVTRQGETYIFQYGNTPRSVTFKSLAISLVEGKIKLEEFGTNGLTTEADGVSSVGFDSNPTINAELHFLQKDGSWALAAPALGWLSSSETCPKTHSGMPWTSVPFSENVQLKWRFWAPGFDIFGEQFTWIAPVKDSPAVPSEPAPSKEIESKKSFKVKCKKGNSVKIFNRSLKNCPAGWSLKK